MTLAQDHAGPRPRIALIHAVTVAIDPVIEAFGRLWPAADCINLLDDSLSPDRARDGDLTPAMRRRIGALANYAEEIGAGGILFTCSAFGEAIEAAAQTASVPVLKPNEAMFEAALERGRHIGMLATFAPSVASMQSEFDALALLRGGPAARIETICVPDAMSALRQGDPERHNRLLADAAPRLAHCDAILLAHFSTSRAEAAVRDVVDRPILTSPGSAVARLRSLIDVAADRPS